MGSLIFRTAARGLLPMFVAFSLFVMLRGHNEPGGGFIGGLLAAAAFALYALAFDAHQARRMLRVEPRRLIGVGLLCAVLSGVAALMIGAPFMQGLWLPFTLPTELKMGTVLLFDVGVYLIVIGATLTILFTLREQQYGE